MDKNGKICATVGKFDKGTLDCDKTKCTFITSGCYSCGDGKKNATEDCDGTDLGGLKCSTVGGGYAAGSLNCNSNCTLDKSGCTKCGNGNIDVGELCDGSNLNNNSCKLEGFDKGQIACNANCTLNKSGCENISCGNGTIEPGEDCEGTNLNKKTCGSLAFTSGQLACASNCIFDKSGCYKCGDGSIDSGEECDGKNLGSASCKLKYDGGQIACKKDCTLDYDGCYKCGDGKVNPGEQCDSAALNSKTCKSEGFFGGSPKCKADCTLDTSGCTNCGNGKIDSGEDCDGAALGGKTCTTLKFDTGTLTCDSNCKLVKTACKLYACGDGKITTGEECDGINLNNKTCELRGFKGGPLACTTNCKFDETKCYRCGDGSVNGTEVCDGLALNNKKCVDLTGVYKYHSGNLACEKDCSGYDTSKCNRCGDGIVNGSEKCDGTAIASGLNCAGLTFDGGQLACYGNCTLNTSGCYKCGDGLVGGPEQCDGTNLKGATCKAKNFHDGIIKCSSCTLDTSGCHDCGDGKIDSGEQCDGSALGGKQCNTLGLGYFTGTLGCKTTCKFDTTACTKAGCGNSTVDAGEDCDGTALGGKSCATLGQGYDGGALGCTASCKYDTANCTYCGDGKIDAGEDCDSTALGGKTCASYFYHGGQLSCDSSCKLVKTKCISHKWVTVKAGTFKMGSATSEYCRASSESQLSVTLTNDFEISNTEVTQEQYKTLISASPSTFSTCGASCPVETVSWHQAAAYCNALSTSKGLGTCYSCSGSGTYTTCAAKSTFADRSIYECPGYRLPTEAEWEYAYRAGSTTSLYNGDITSSASCQGKDANADLISWYKSTAQSTPHTVGSKVPNNWGLYDMAGNVIEWSNDWYIPSLGTSAVTDPFGTAGLLTRVAKGGSWGSHPGGLRAAQRYSATPTTAGSQTGFRCARTLNPPLVALWKLDDGSGTKASDSSGNGNYGTVKTGASWVTGWTGKALSFDGSAGHVEIAEPYAVDKKAITVAAWIKTSATGNFIQILGNGFGPTVAHFEFGVHSTGEVHLFEEISGATVLKSSTLVNTGVWTHVAWTRDDTGKDSLYVNGVFEVSRVLVGDISDNKTWWLGGNHGGGNYFKGALDDVRVYRKALSAADVLAVYKAADPKFKYFAAGSTVTTGKSYADLHDLHVTTGPRTLLIAYSGHQKILRSTDKGKNWSEINMGTTDLSGPRIFNLDSSTVGITTIVGGANSKLRYSSDDAKTFSSGWISMSNHGSATTRYHGVVHRLPSATLSYIGAWVSTNIYSRTSTNITNDWPSTTPAQPLSVTNVSWPVFASVGSTLYLLVHSDSGAELYKSTNLGGTYTLVGKIASHKISGGWRARQLWYDAYSGYWYVCGATAPGSNVTVYYTYSKDGGKTWAKESAYLKGIAASDLRVPCHITASGIYVAYVKNAVTKVVLPAGM